MPWPPKNNRRFSMNRSSSASKLGMTRTLVFLVALFTVAPLNAQISASLERRSALVEIPTSVPAPIGSTWAFSFAPSAGSHRLLLEQEPGIGKVVIGSIVGWGLGALAGGWIGNQLGRDYGGYFGPEEMWIGAWLGSSVGSAVGAHLANGRRGNVVVASLLSIGSVPATIILMRPLMSGNAAPLAVPLIPAVQIGVSVSVERGSGRSEGR